MKKERISGKVIIRISIMWVFVLAIVVASLIAFFKNNIFAVENMQEEKEIEQTVAIEENNKAVNVLELLIENNYSNKRLTKVEQEVEFEIEEIETDKLPNGERKIEQEGVVGKKQVTILQTFEDNNIISEEVMDSIVIEEPIKQIICVGTSEFLGRYNVHIGEEMYLIESGELKEQADENSETILKLRRYINVNLEDILGEWAKIKYQDKEGYILASKLTSDSVTPKIEEKNRIAVIQSELNIEMDLSKPSGLTLNDFKTIFGFNASDKNGIFSENAEVFYEMEYKYNINGIFLASIGIHESAWGTSQIANEKHNLFGYQAYDRDPLNSAKEFEDYKEGIETVAKALRENYLTEGGAFYNGTTIESVNKKYASDEEWYLKVYAYMEYLYDKLG